MGKHTPYYELRDALAEPGCAICRLSLRAVQRSMDSLVYEYANDAEVQEGVRRARGFCNLHAWQLREQRGAALDLAILNKVALEASLAALRGLDGDEVGPGGHAKTMRQMRTALGMDVVPAESRAIANTLEPESDCPACIVRKQAETMFLRMLLEYMDDDEISSSFEHAGGLCWPHVRMALRQPATERQVRHLLKLQQHATEHLLEELAEFVRKQDYRFSGELLGTEGDSWIRAIAQVSGLRGVW